jgi:HD-like signal output (HDOD) protein
MSNGSALPTDGAPVPRPDVLRRRVERLKSMPTLPRLLERVVGALGDPDVNFENVGSLIEVDQSLSSQILRLANSAFYSAQGRVSRVPNALLMLGTVVTRSVVLSTSVFDVRKVPLRGFWEHSLGCAVAAGAIAKVTGAAQPEEVSAAGLLHDLGKVVLCKELPAVFAHILGRADVEERSFRELEHEELGIDHGEVAGWLVTRWNLPACLAEPIMYHHEPGRARRALRETAIVHVANSLVRMLDYGNGGDRRIPPIDPKAWTMLSLDGPTLDRIIATFTRDLDHALNFALFE